MLIRHCGLSIRFGWIKEKPKGFLPFPLVDLARYEFVWHPHQPTSTRACMRHASCIQMAQAQVTAIYIRCAADGAPGSPSWHSSVHRAPSGGRRSRCDRQCGFDKRAWADQPSFRSERDPASPDMRHTSRRGSGAPRHRCAAQMVWRGAPR